LTPDDKAWSFPLQEPLRNSNKLTYLHVRL